MNRQSRDPVKRQGDSIIEANVHIHGRVELAEKIWLEPNVTIYGPATVGKGTYIGSNSVIGFPQRGELAEMLRTMNRKPRFEGKATKIGESVQIRSNCVLYSDVRVGDRVRFGHNVMVREQVTIGNDTLVGTGVTVDGSCTIGRNVSIQTNVYISTNTLIEDRVFLGPCCALINDKYVGQTPYDLKGPIIKRGASIGANATILPGIEIGEGAIVGAGAVVTKNVPPKIIVTGIPSEKLRNVPESWGLK